MTIMRMRMRMRMITFNSPSPFMKDDGGDRAGDKNHDRGGGDDYVMTVIMMVTIMVIVVMMIDTFIASIRKQLGKLGPKNWHLGRWLLKLFKVILETVGSE